jgi:hypothetical protein
VDKVTNQEPALDAGLTSVDFFLLRGDDVQDFSLFDIDLDPATQAAERTNGFSRSFRKGFRPDGSFHQGAGRTDIDTGSAELAAGFPERPSQRRPHLSLRTAKNKRDGRGAPDFMTDAYAPAAENAEVVVPVKEGIILPDVQTAVERREIDLFNSNGFSHFLELATRVVGTEDAARNFPRFPYGGFFFLASVFLKTDEAGVRMFGKDELQYLSPQLPDPWSLGQNFHPFFAKRTAGRGKTPLAFHFDQANSAAGKRRKLSMITERRDLDAGLSGCLKNGLPALYPDFPTVNDDFHPLTFSSGVSFNKSVFLFPVYLDTALTFGGQTFKQAPHRMQRS